MKKVLLILAALLVTGCAQVPPPTMDELSKADYGLFPKDYETQVKAYFEKSLKDPFSVQYMEITKPVKVYTTGGPERHIYLYQTCATYNAKNSYGAYVGWKTVEFLFKNGSIFTDQTGWYNTNIHCKK